MQQSRKNVQFIAPPNRLKQKVGSGGLPREVIEKAQRVIDTNSVDMLPQAKILHVHIKKGIDQIRSDLVNGYGYTEKSRNALIYPVMQLKANGTMFHYPLITSVAERFLDFIETLDQMNKDALAIIEAFYKTLALVIQKRMQDNSTHLAGEFLEELDFARKRYYRRYKPGNNNSPDVSETWHMGT